MGTFVGVLIFLGVVATIALFVLGFIRENKGEAYHSTWKASLYSFAATCLLVVLLGLVSSGFALVDMVLMLWIFISIAMFVFIALALRSRFKNQSPRRHFRRAGIAFATGLALFFMFTLVPNEVEEPANQTALADEESEELTEEVTEETTEETTTEEEKDAAEKKAAEKKAAEEKAAKEAEEKEASIEAAKKKEESIEAAKKEKEKEESIEAAKAKEESIEKAEAAKEKSIEEEQAAAAKAEEEAKKEAAPKEGLIPVSLYRIVDGDTVNVLDDEGNELKLRLLLIDTPETVHPNKPVQPYGHDASDRLTQLLNAADQLYIEYDDGAKTDHYDRQLVYLYADDASVHEVLLEEGLARVGYIYEQQRYLSEFRAAEQKAKDQQIGVWSIPGYVNTDGEGFNSEEPEPTSEPATSEPATSEPATSEPAQTTEFFQNCTELKTVYPDGVAQGHAAYQGKMDRDKDGYACE
ncbi:thermonuclease family protein [Salinicoccus sp. ID82-1]|uniref:thermonuclease family protein n=1 Tax=Salinicoccus sp. ID82-1 TaxID=2820269 RepID=UPI001F42B317|nr:thermonuclease family protein [Salinicoccus sp. ID82-1]MCG1009204.1 thermonuclease family protein [Salinicoccus sp. ID82-1]